MARRIEEIEYEWKEQRAFSTPLLLELAGRAFLSRREIGRKSSDRGRRGKIATLPTGSDERPRGVYGDGGAHTFRVRR